MFLRIGLACGLVVATHLLLPAAKAAADETSWLDLKGKSLPATVEDSRRERFEQRYDCLAGRGDARLCGQLEDQARQGQADAVRQSTSPAPLTPPQQPHELPARGMPLPGGR